MGYNINKIAIVGMESIGGQLAAFLSAVSSQVVLLGNKCEGSNANKTTEDAIKILKKRKAFFDSKLISKVTIANIEDDFNVLSDVDLIIENIDERFSTKEELLKKIEEIKKPQTIVATTSVGSSVNDLCNNRTAAFKEKFVGLGFHQPLRTNLGVELVPNDLTSQEIIEAMQDFITKKMGKNVAISKDTPGFIVYRSAIETMIKAIQLMDQYNLSIDTVEQLTTNLIGRTKKMGVFRTIDAIGIKKFCLSAKQYAVKMPAEDFRYELPTFITEMASKNLKFYTKADPKKKDSAVLIWDRESSEYVEMNKVQYTEDASLVLGKEFVNIVEKYKNEKNISKKVNALVDDKSVHGLFVWELVKDFLLYSSTEMMEVVENYKVFDKVLKNSMHWQVGPFELWDALGVKKAANRMKAEGHEIPEWVEAIDSFYSSEEELPYIDLKQSKYEVVFENSDCKTRDIGDGVLCIEFIGQGNSLTTNVTEVISKTLDLVEQNGIYSGIVIANQGQFFSAGANLFEVMSNAGYGMYDDIDTELKEFQPLMSRILTFGKPIVAAPFNMTLGGGTEICLHAHKVVAHSETYMGLVEASVGVIPVAGGTKEILKRFTMEMPNVKLVDNLAFVQKAWELISLAKMSSSAHNAQALGYLRRTDKIVMHKDYLISEAKNEVVKMAEDFQPYVETKIPVLGVDGKASLQIIARTMLDGNMITPYEYDLSVKIANVLTGNGVAQGTLVDEKTFYDNERNVFIDQLSNQKTLDRMKYKLTTGGKTLRN